MSWFWTMMLAGCALDPRSGPELPAAPVRFVAASEDGRRVALLFESSELWVLEAGADEPVLRSVLAAGHSDPMARAASFGLRVDNALVPVDGAWPTQHASDNIIQGVVDLYPSPVAFAVEPSVDSSCAGMQWTVRSGSEVAPPVPSRCVQDVRLCAVYRGSQALWFVGEQDTEDGVQMAVAGLALR